MIYWNEKRTVRRKHRRPRRRYTISIKGLFILAAKIVWYGFWLTLPFLIWGFARLDHVAGGHFLQYKPYAILFLYVTMAVEFVRNTNNFILQGSPWDERIFIEKTTYKDNNYYSGYDDDDSYDGY